ncbi:hypothetical protein E1J61_27235 [Cupriavidus sp. L7L]|nr:hypothetical protein E1J61_27235 [Cupriavidus sp. L7L]
MSRLQQGFAAFRLSHDQRYCNSLIRNGIGVQTARFHTKSGSSGALLRHRPLGTVQASFPAYGSSHSSAPWAGTG